MEIMFAESPLVSTVLTRLKMEHRAPEFQEDFVAMVHVEILPLHPVLVPQHLVVAPWWVQVDKHKLALVMLPCNVFQAVPPSVHLVLWGHVLNKVLAQLLGEFCSV